MASEAYERLAAERDKLEQEGKTIGPAAAPFTGKDEGAPHGRTRDGRPRPRAGATRTTRRSTRDEGKDYREQILGLFQLPAGALAVAGINNPVYAADSRAVTVYSPGIAESLNDLAQQRPEVATALERVLAVGPYGAVLAAVMPLCLQILTNHGKLPAGVAGTVPPTELIADLIAEVNPNGQQSPNPPASPEAGISGQFTGD